LTVEAAALALPRPLTLCRWEMPGQDLSAALTPSIGPEDPGEIVLDFQWPA
jgi:hypothetical protein